MKKKKTHILLHMLKTPKPSFLYNNWSETGLDDILVHSACPKTTFMCIAYVLEELLI